MCAGDDRNCPDFELHHRNFKETLDRERRSFLRSSFAAAGGAAAMTAGGISLVTPQMAAAAEKNQPAKRSYHHLPANAETVHWGYFSKKLKPQVEIDSGDFITIEALTHHANDDSERMVKGDPGAESVFLWTKEKKNVNRRGAGPMDASLFGRGAGEGLGVHICTGPVYVRGAQEGDVIELRIIDVTPRPCANPQYPGKAFGSNAAAWWGFHYNDLLTEPKPREVITIYEVDATGERNWAKAVYNFRWTPQTDPSGVVHKTIDYPGVPVDHATVKETHGILKNVRIPIRPHFGVIGLAPKEADIVDSIPPNYTGGNIDNWRIGKGATMYYPVAVEGGLLSVGDFARFPGRFRALRYRHRMLAERHLPDHPAQEGRSRRHGARSARLSDAGNQGRVAGARLQLRQLPHRIGRQGAVGHLLEILRRPRLARRVPQDAQVPDDDQEADRG